ncbi:WD40 repeat protein [Hamadaea flava]|uniref:WD40 repeat domain-containing protein n=1 Tax=Hamadaea flava TaxID=1742688 RepID=A0ABV8LXF7_9ACTN|nr:WD40 repeat domain-containing protein [Hamadaea flava]MCP2327026.1 WD40 repeat protein [Hamadaea flava]
MRIPDATPIVVTAMLGHRSQCLSVAEGTVRLWDPSKGPSSGTMFAPQTSFGGPTAVAIADSPDGPLVVGGSAGYGLWRWNQTTGEPIGTPITDWAMRGMPSRLPMAVVAGSPGPVMVVGCDDGYLRSWNAVDGKPTGEPWPVHDQPIWSLAVVDGGGAGPVLVSGAADGLVKAWDPVTRQPVGTPLAKCGIPVAVFSVGPGLVGVASASGNIHVGDLSTGRRVTKSLSTGWQPAPGQPWFPGDVTYAGGLLAAAVVDTVHRWDPLTGEPTGDPIAVGDRVSALTTVHQENGGPMLLAATEDTRVQQFDLVTGRQVAPVVHPHAGNPNRVDVVRIGREQITLVVETRSRIASFDVRTGQLLGVLRRMGWFGVAVAGLADGSTVVVGADEDGIVRVAAPRLTVHDPTPDETPMTIWDVAAVTLPDGRIVIAGAGHDWLVYRWDAATGRSLGEPSAGHPISVKVVAAAVVDGVATLFSGCEAGQVRRWDAATGQPMGEPLASGLDHMSGLTVVRANAGQHILVGFDLDGVVHYWDAGTGELIWSGDQMTPMSHLLHTYQDRSGHTVLVYVITESSVGEGLGRWDVEARRVIPEPLPDGTCAVYNDDDHIMLARCTTDGALIIEPLDQPPSAPASSPSGGPLRCGIGGRGEPSGSPVRSLGRVR